jgi:nucleoporin POM34
VFGDGPATPTPVTGKKSSVSLNSKWLYEKGRRSSGSSWLHQNLS